MDWINCPLCASEKFVPRGSVHDRLLGTEGQFCLVCCLECGLYYLNPQPGREELKKYYTEEYDLFQNAPFGRLPWWQRLSIGYGLNKRRKVVERFKKGGRLLEIGCARGTFLWTMRRRGRWEVYGVEPSKTACKAAREEFQLEIFQGTLEEAAFSSRSFDVVVLWDVLEHVSDPKSTLQEIRRLLVEDGVLILRVPQLGSWDQRLFGPYWVGWEAPRHLTTFSRVTLNRMLAASGFKVKKYFCFSGGYPAFTVSLRFWARDHLPSWGQKSLRLLAESPPARLAFAPFFYLMDRLVKSTVVTVVAVPEKGADPPGGIV
jgi:2-polyprenyl-3-methyl-5-hydroxy-6-metoxy-1,4-benzoquinol methylase